MRSVFTAGDVYQLSYLRTINDEKLSSIFILLTAIYLHISDIYPCKCRAQDEITPAVSIPKSDQATADLITATATTKTTTAPSAATLPLQGGEILAPIIIANMATIHEAEIIATATETKGVLEMLIPQILVGGDPTPTSAAEKTKTAAAAPAAPVTTTATALGKTTTVTEIGARAGR